MFHLLDPRAKSKPLLAAPSFVECLNHAEALEDRRGGSTWRETRAFLWEWDVDARSGQRYAILDHTTGEATPGHRTLRARKYENLGG